MKILVTGAAGFIRSMLSIKLLERGDEVIGIDNLNDYYDVNLKLARLKRLKNYNRVKFLKPEIADKQATENLFFPGKGAKSHVSAGLGRSEIFIESSACLCRFQFSWFYRYIERMLA